MRHCCCCISLRTGTVILGIGHLVSSIIGIVLMAAVIRNIGVPTAYEKPMENAPEGEVGVYNSYRGLEPYHIVLYSVCSIILVYMIVVALTSALMIYGAIRRVSNCIFPWLAVDFASLVCAACTVVTSVSVIAVLGSHLEYLASVAVTALGIAVHYYFWLAVFTYYKEIVGVEAQHRALPKIGQVVPPPPIYPIHNS